MKIRIIIGSILTAISFFVLAVILINYYVLSFSDNGYYDNVSNLPENYTGLVLGASVIGKNTPSPILRDRLDVAVSAYRIGKIQKIIVSGDNSQNSYNEPLVMSNYLISNGVDSEDIYLDYAGFDTYDSLYRAKEIFQTDRLTVFTQGFHLKRAIYIGNRLGIDIIGAETNLNNYVDSKYNNRREVLARIKAFVEVEIFKSKPTYLGDKIEIITDEKIENTKKEILKDK